MVSDAQSVAVEDADVEEVLEKGNFCLQTTNFPLRWRY